MYECMRAYACACVQTYVCVYACMYVLQCPLSSEVGLDGFVPPLILKSFLCLCFSNIWQNQRFHGKNERHMINRIYHSYSCIIKFNEPCCEKEKMLGKPRIVSLFFPTRLINSIKHEHPCTIKHEHTCKILCLFRSSTYKPRIFCKSKKDSKDQETINQAPLLT